MPVDEKVEPQVFGSDGVGFYEFGDDFFEVVLGIVVLDSQELVLDAVNKQAADILLRDEQDRLFFVGVPAKRKNPPENRNLSPR